MTSYEEKLCPFDKAPCIRARCAVWSSDDEVCAFALLSRVIERPIGQKRPAERPPSSGLSGKYRDPLFG